MKIIILILMTLCAWQTTLATTTLSTVTRAWYDKNYDGSIFNMVETPNGLFVIFYGYKGNSDTDRAIHLIEQLLTLARIDPQQTLTEVSAIDWLSISDQALKSANYLARQKNIRLKRTIDTEDGKAPLPISGEPTLLTLLLRNLLDNAIRYSENDSKVELILMTDRLVVRDYGSGIDPEYLTRIRERFFRPAGQIETGSGLGLSIVECIAELHQLKLTLHNHAQGGLEAIISH